VDELGDPEEELPDEEAELELCPLPSASAMTSKIVNANTSKLQNTWFRTLFPAISSGREGESGKPVESVTGFIRRSVVSCDVSDSLEWNGRSLKRLDRRSAMHGCCRIGSDALRTPRVPTRITLFETWLHRCVGCLNCTGHRRIALAAWIEPNFGVSKQGFSHLHHRPMPILKPRSHSVCHKHDTLPLVGMVRGRSSVAHRRFGEHANREAAVNTKKSTKHISVTPNRQECKKIE